MTTVKAILIAIIFIFCNNIDAQNLLIETCGYKSSHIIFPAPIIYADVGDSENYIFEYTGNVLRLKGRKTGRATNLTVITGEEDYFSFRVVYNEYPRLNYFITGQMRMKNLAADRAGNKEFTKDKIAGQLTLEKKINVKKKEHVAKHESSKKKPVGKGSNSKKEKDTVARGKAVGLLNRGHLYDFVGAEHGDIRLKVTGIYHAENRCFIVYDIQNRGAVPYDISYVEFGVKEKRRPKKSALNEKILYPLFTVKGDIGRVNPRRLNSYVAVFEKLAVPRGKLLYLKIVENGRNISLDIPYNKLPIGTIK